MKRLRMFAFILVLCFATALFSGCSRFGASAGDLVFPKDGFLTATPESQGIDTSGIISMIKNSQNEERNDKPLALAVLKNGYLVSQSFFEGFDMDARFPVDALTHNVMSALVGIAIADGLITGVDQKVSDFFPDSSFDDDKKYKYDITVEHLLTMSSGIDADSFWEKDWENEIEDFGKEIFEITQYDPPGVSFKYDYLSTHLLSYIITGITGMSTLEYAQKKLFDPIGIKNVKWDEDIKGVNYGCFDLHMTVGDMLRFGLLYLNNGAWDGKQIIPADYIEKTHTPSKLESGFGYLFDIDKNLDGALVAGRYGGWPYGCILYIDYKRSMVTAVVTKYWESLSYRDLQLKSDITPLPEAPDKQQELESLVSAYYPALPSADTIISSVKPKKAYDIDLASLECIKRYNYDDGGDKNTFSYKNEKLIIKTENDNYKYSTPSTYTLPLRIDLTARTDDTNIRIGYEGGTVILGWEYEPNMLRVHDVIETNYQYSFINAGGIEKDKDHDITWIICKDRQALIVDGIVRMYSKDFYYVEQYELDPLKHKNAPVWISTAFGSTMTVSGLKITELE